MRSQPVKCNMMQLTRKWIKKINAVSLEGIVLENVDNIKYLAGFSLSLKNARLGLFLTQISLKPSSKRDMDVP